MTILDIQLTLTLVFAKFDLHVSKNYFKHLISTYLCVIYNSITTELIFK